MDKNGLLMWETSDGASAVLVLTAAICLWGFIASAATIYSATLAHWI